MFFNRADWRTCLAAVRRLYEKVSINLDNDPIQVNPTQPAAGDRAVSAVRKLLYDFAPAPTKNLCAVHPPKFENQQEYIVHSFTFASEADDFWAIVDVIRAEQAEDLFTRVTHREEARQRHSAAAMNSSIIRAVENKVAPPLKIDPMVRVRIVRRYVQGAEAERRGNIVNYPLDQQGVFTQESVVLDEDGLSFAGYPQRYKVRLGRAVREIAQEGAAACKKQDDRRQMLAARMFAWDINSESHW